MDNLFRGMEPQGLAPRRRKMFGPTVDDATLAAGIRQAQQTGDYRQLQSYAADPSILQRIQAMIAQVGGAYSPEQGASINPSASFNAGPVRVNIKGNYGMGPQGRSYGLRGSASAPVGGGEMSLSGNYDGGARPQAGARLTYRRNF